MLRFCFQFCGDHLDLHSFPTRRSSDLLAFSLFVRRPKAKAFRPLSRPGSFLLTLIKSNDPPQAEAFASILRRVRNQTRSEEHTSELQSRENLVCRLLLEKKNNKTKRMH